MGECDKEIICELKSESSVQSLRRVYDYCFEELKTTLFWSFTFTFFSQITFCYISSAHRVMWGLRLETDSRVVWLWFTSNQWMYQKNYISSPVHRKEWDDERTKSFIWCVMYQKRRMYQKDDMSDSRWWILAFKTVFTDISIIIRKQLFIVLFVLLYVVTDRKLGA